MHQSTTTTVAESAPPPAPATAAAPPETLRSLSPAQWRSGIAAWLGWLFDGLDMHLYTLVATPFILQLLSKTALDAEANHKMALIQGSFLVGWAIGGAFFGRLGDVLGRSRSLALTILTYAVFTGLSFVAQTWWQLLIFRFLAALGIGGEWAVGSSLLSETWPKRWRPWVAACLQTAVNLGVLAACAAGIVLSEFSPRYVFLVGILPALLVFWIRKSVPEPQEWHDAHASTGGEVPRVTDLFRGSVRRTTVLTIIVCASSLTAWWAFMFWNSQYMPRLPDVAGWPEGARRRLVSSSFFLVIGVSIAGNFFAGWLAKVLGFRRAIVIMCVGFFLAMFGTYVVPRDHQSMLRWIPWVGFFSGVFGLFTMYLPPLFPTLLRTTGAGFSYNIGRIVAAAGTVFFGFRQLGNVDDFRRVLLYTSFVFLPAAAVALMLPELPTGDDAAPARPPAAPKAA
jgi:MFS family permease